MFLLIDNYDSFVYNLYQLAGSFVPDVMVARSDAVTADEVESLAPEAILLSPGPGRPEDNWAVWQFNQKAAKITALLEDFKGRYLVAFGGLWAMNFMLKHNPGLEFSETLSVE